MDINDRIKELRKVLGITQTEFGTKIGMTTGAISDIERGRVRQVTERTIKLVCRVFNINEEWLRTGVGEMFKELDIVDELNAQFELTEIQKIFVRQLMALSPEKKKIVDELIIGMYNALKKEGM